MAPLLEVKNLKTYFTRSNGIIKAVDGISYKLDKGETLGIVGESGSGKSVSVLSLLKLIRKNGKIDGEAIFNGRDILKLDKEQLRLLRGGEISMIFQDPMTSMNPSYKIKLQMSEPPIWHKLMGKTDSHTRALELLKKVGIPEYQSRINDYPYQFSGGMRQRVMIAMALTCNPKLLIADEPTTALDSTVRSQILNLMQDMKEELGMSIIMITHDFSMATNFCDRIIVMYAGHIAETAPTMEFIKNSQHPYSLGLLSSTLDIDLSNSKLKPIPGQPPNMLNPPQGCKFNPRCELCKPICLEQEPELRQVGDNHFAACHFAKGAN